MPNAPEELGGKTLSELLADGTVVLNIDGKYPQAIGIGNVMRHANNFGNCHWDILINSVACRRSSPSTKRFIPTSADRHHNTRSTRFHTAWAQTRH